MISKDDFTNISGPFVSFFFDGYPAPVTPDDFKMKTLLTFTVGACILLGIDLGRVLASSQLDFSPSPASVKAETAIS